MKIPPRYLHFPCIFGVGLPTVNWKLVENLRGNRCMVEEKMYMCLCVTHSCVKD